MKCSWDGSRHCGQTPDTLKEQRKSEFRSDGNSGIISSRLTGDREAAQYGGRSSARNGKEMRHALA